MTELEYVALGDLLSERPRNGFYKATKFVGPGTSYFRMGDLFREDRVSSATTGMQQMDCSVKEIERHQLQPGELLFCRTSVASEGVGKCSVVASLAEPIIPASNMIRVRVDPEKADPRFIYYYFRSEVGGSELRGRTRGAAVFTITGSDVAESPVPNLDLGTQRGVADLLWSFDDLIENNRSRVEVLEEMARAIYREWFVHFRFPGHEDATFVDSDLGPIPDDWAVRPLGDVITLNYGKALKKAARRGGPVAVLGSSGVVGWHDESVVAGPAIVLGRKGNVGAVTWVDGDAWPIDTTYFVETNLPLRFACEQLRRIEFLNTHAAVPGLSRDQAYSKNFLLPDKAMMDRFAASAEVLLSEASMLVAQSERLAAIRDLLLPKLVTGQIDVSGLDLDAVMDRAGV